MYWSAIFIAVCNWPWGSLPFFGMTQLVEVYNFKDDCAKRIGTASYISTCNYTFTRDYYLDDNDRLTDNGKRYRNASRAGLVNGHAKKNLTFTFRFGEVRWRAASLSLSCKYGKSNLEIRPLLDNGRWHLPTDIVGLVTCLELSGLDTFVQDSRFRTGNETKYLSWKCDLKSCWPHSRVLDGIHSYTLRWTPDELRWLIDDYDVLHVRDKRKIPFHMMVLTVSDLDTVPHKGYLNMIVESLSVWQDPMYAGVISAEEQPQQRHAWQLLQNKTTLVKVYSLNEQCTNFGYDSDFVTACNFDVFDLNTYERTSMDYLHVTNDMTDAEMFREIRKSALEHPYAFTFRYGEVRWRAQPFAGAPSVLTIEGPSKQPRTDIHKSVYLSILLIVPPQGSSAKTQRFDTVRAALLAYQQSNSTNAWTCANSFCPKHSENLWHALHNYMLRWTPDELVWLIDDIPLYRLADKRKIPRHPMTLKVHPHVITQNGLHGHAVNMWVESMSVWQNRTALVEPDLPVLLHDNFTGSVLDGQSWNAMQGDMNQESYPYWYIEYDSKLASVVNGTLQLGIRQGNRRVYFGRVDGTIKNNLLYPGEVEWRMRFNYSPGFLSVLRVQQNVCKYPEKPLLNQNCFSISIPGFGFAFDEWGKVITTLDLGLLQPVPGEFDIEIPVERQRKRYDGLVREGRLEDFHIYRVVWTSEYIAWYIDGQEIDREDLTTQYRLLEDLDPLSVSMGTLLSDKPKYYQENDRVNSKRYLLMEIDYVTLRSPSNDSIRTVVTPEATTPFEFPEGIRKTTLTDESNHLLIAGPTSAAERTVATVASISDTPLWFTEQPSDPSTSRSPGDTRLPSVTQRQLVGNTGPAGTQWTASHTTAAVTLTCIFAAVCGSVFAITYWKRRRRSTSSYGHLNATNYQSDAAPAFDLDALARTSYLADLVTRYTCLLEVPENCIDIQDLNTPTTILGKGSYGIVLLGVATQLPTLQRGPTVVAVKILTDHASLEGQKAFADEVKIMVKAAGHVNVVNILGVVNQGRPFIILEYCKFGSLQSYLRNHQPNSVYAHVDIADGTLLPLDACAMKAQWLLADEQNRSRDADLSTISKEMLCTADLIQFSFQVSRGMEYLGARHIVHRDLAARNVLVNERRILKISDFGLARYAEQNYTTENSNVRLPYLWMSPDALTTKTFSSKSDVWSFGVLLHEIFTLGEEPFNGPNVARLPVSAFVSWLMNGNQMSRPTRSPIAMYEVMRWCWRLSCDDRPTFSQLRKSLDALTLVAVKSDHYVSLADERPGTNEGTVFNLRTYSELDNLQRMIGECCSEAADMMANDTPAVAGSYVSPCEAPLFSSDSGIR